MKFINFSLLLVSILAASTSFASSSELDAYFSTLDKSIGHNVFVPSEGSYGEVSKVSRPWPIIGGGGGLTIKMKSGKSVFVSVESPDTALKPIYGKADCCGEQPTAIANTLTSKVSAASAEILGRDLENPTYYIGRSLENAGNIKKGEFIVGLIPTDKKNILDAWSNNVSKGNNIRYNIDTDKRHVTGYGNVKAIFVAGQNNGLYVYWVALDQPNGQRILEINNGLKTSIYVMNHPDDLLSTNLCPALAGKYSCVEEFNNAGSETQSAPLPFEVKIDQRKMGQSLEYSFAGFLKPRDNSQFNYFRPNSSTDTEIKFITDIDVAPNTYSETNLNSAYCSAGEDQLVVLQTDVDQELVNRFHLDPNGTLKIFNADTRYYPGSGASESQRQVVCQKIQ